MQYSIHNEKSCVSPSDVSPEQPMQNSGKGTEDPWQEILLASILSVWTIMLIFKSPVFVDLEQDEAFI